MKIYSKGIGVVLAITALSACKAPKVVIPNNEHKAPEVFTVGARDTSFDISAMTVDNFFADAQLKNLIQKALQDNWDYKIALQRINIADAYFRKAKGRLFPSIDGLANASGTKYGKYTMEGVGNFDTNLSPNIEEDQKIKTNPVPNFFLGLGASWEIDVWGKLRNMREGAKKRYFATIEGRKLLEATLVSQVAMAYYDLIALDQEISILNTNIKLQENALEIVNVQYEVGRATKLAVMQSQAQLNNSKSLLKLKQQELQDAEMMMQELIGEYEGSVTRSEKIDIAAVKMLTMNAVPTQVMKNRPDIQKAYLELEATHADAKAARAAFFPTLTLNAYGAYNAFSGEMLFNPKSMAWQLLGGLTAPIFNQGQLKNDFKIATNEQQIAYFEFQKTAMNAYREVNNLLKNIVNTNDAYDFKEKEVAAIKEGVGISNDLYLTGYATYLEIIAAQKSKLEADLQIIELKRRQVQNYIQLYKALGGGYTAS